MHIERRVKNFQIPYVTYHDCGALIGTKFLTVSYEVFYSYSHDMQRRVKPSPLELYQTPRGYQFTRWSGSSTGVPFVVYQQGNYGLPCKAETFSNNGIRFIPGFQLNTNWELAVRLKIKSSRQNLSDSLAEYRDAGDAFSNTTRRIKKAWDCYKKLRKGRKCKRNPLTTQDASSTALLVDWGVVPALNDLGEAMQRLADKSGHIVSKKIYVVSRAHEEQVSGSGVLLQGDVIEKTRVYVRYNASALTQWTPGNFPEFLWNATAFSHIVDWLIPIGDYLSSLDALDGVVSVTGTRARHIKYHWHVNPKMKFNGKPITNVANVFEEGYERILVNSVPHADLPSYSPSFSWRKIWDGVNLLNVLRNSI